MASLTTSSQRSSSSYSSSRYSTSSSYTSEGSLNGSSDSLEALLEPFIDSTNSSGLFEEENPAGPNYLPHIRCSRSSYGHLAPVGGAVSTWQTGAGSGGNYLGDTYYMSADVSRFEPHDIVVMAFNHQVVVQAQKVLDDGSVIDTFTHKSQFPEDMDPLSISGNLNSDGILLVGVRRTTVPSGPEPLGVSTYRSQSHL